VLHSDQEPLTEIKVVSLIVTFFYISCQQVKIGPKYFYCLLSWQIAKMIVTTNGPRIMKMRQYKLCVLEAKF